MADLPIKPNNREEMYLSSMAGLSEDVPACPYSRKEAYLDAATERVNGLAEVTRYGYVGTVFGNLPMIIDRTTI